MSFDRGTFDPKADPFPGSSMDIGVSRALAGSISRMMAFLKDPPLPKDISVQDLLALVRTPRNFGNVVEQRYRDKVRSPLTAIRAFCVDCSAFSPREAWNCPNVDCPIWPFHRGKNGLRKRD